MGVSIKYPKLSQKREQVFQGREQHERQRARQVLEVFLPGRLRFGGSKSGAPFPSALVVFGDLPERQKERVAGLGWAVETRR
jgi:hypothetical protein